MNIKEYISSGIIEAYVMGLASEEEVRILECVQKNNLEVRQAILDAQNTLESLASQQAITPPSHLQAAIWDKISKENAYADLEEKRGVPKVVPLPITQNTNSSNKPLKWYAIAASILLISSISINLYYNTAKNELKNELKGLTITQNKTHIAYQNLKSKWDMANNPSVKTIPLLGVEKHPEMKALVYLEQASNAIYLSLENLPETPKNQQYQLWAIVNGQPVSLGVYNQDTKTALQKMASITNAKAFAITLEKRGGSDKPTLSNMYVMGKV